MSKLTFLLTVTLTHVQIRSQLNPSGPRHPDLVTSCLLNLVQTQFKPMDSEYGLTALTRTMEQERYAAPYVLTFVASDFPTAPAFEIQRLLLQKLHQLLEFNLETVTPARPTCDECRTRPPGASRFFLFITTSSEHFRRVIDFIETLPNYQPRAQFIVYFTQRLSDFERTANELLQINWNKFIYNSIIVLPKDLSHFYGFVGNFTLENGVDCVSQKPQPIGECKGWSSAVYYSKPYLPSRHDFNNCQIDVIAHLNEPFVISANFGIEMSLLETIRDELRFDFNVTLMEDDAWGSYSPEEGWNGDLEKVWRTRSIGIGNFIYVVDYLRDFDRTVPHWNANLIWVVPLAGLVPKWRVLFIIFGWDVWLLILAMVVVSGGLMTFTSIISKNSISSYQQWNYGFLVALQVLVSSATYRQPTQDWTRIVFVAFAIFSMIVSSVYTSSFINYLQNPIREHQINSFADILAYNLDVGGLNVFLQMFNVSEDDESIDIYERYEVNESASYWWRSVADDRDTATMATEVSMQYMLAHNHSILTSVRSKPKVFMIRKDKLLSYGVSIVFHRSFPFKAVLNRLLVRMVEAGLVEKLGVQFGGRTDRSRDEGEQKLSMDNVQAAFFVLIFGCLLAVGCLGLECALEIVLRKFFNKRN